MKTSFSKVYSQNKELALYAKSQGWVCKSLRWVTFPDGFDVDTWKPSKGLGDYVADIAQPIAKAIDSVMGTNIQECGGCKKRREALNKLLP